MRAAVPIGVYVHFPYCERVCPYCDFAVAGRARGRIDHAGYADAVLRELGWRAEGLRNRSLASVYFGGGTPSLWEPRELGRVLDAIVACAAGSDGDLEVTVECNPESLDLASARALVAAGANRLSLGVQTLDEGRLRFLGRSHRASDALAATEAALRSGARRVSVDLIYGVRTETTAERPEEAADEALRFAERGVGHVSAYSLTIEERTVFGKLARRGALPIADDGIVAQSFLAIRDALEGASFAHYEISNYARAGETSRHNLGYWCGDDYLGLGCGAVGTLAEPDHTAVRYRNEPRAAAYLRAVGADGEALELERERLDSETRLRERIMLGLRLADGIDLGAAGRALGLDAWTAGRESSAAELVRGGRLERHGDRLRIPKDARLFADGTAAALF